MRVTIAGLMLVVAVCALGAAAIKYSSNGIADTVFTLALCAVIYGASEALFDQPGPSRAFWRGFALFGGIYLALCFAPGFTTAVRPLLLTTRLLQGVETYVGGAEPSILLLYSLEPIFQSTVGSATPPPSQTLFVGGSASVSTPIVFAAFDAFERTGHGLLSLAFAFLGGFLARRRLQMTCRAGFQPSPSETRIGRLKPALPEMTKTPSPERPRFFLLNFSARCGEVSGEEVFSTLPVVARSNGRGLYCSAHEDDGLVP